MSDGILCLPVSESCGWWGHQQAVPLREVVAVVRHFWDELGGYTWMKRGRALPPSQEREQVNESLA